MSPPQFEVYNFKKAGIIISAYMVFTALFLQLLIMPCNRRLSNLEENKVNLKDDLNLYENADDVLKNYLNGEDTITNILGIYNQKTNCAKADKQDILEMIVKISRQSGIKIDRITSVDSQNNVWSVIFKSNFQRIGEFIYNLENNPVIFKISDLAITGGQNDSKHRVKLITYNVERSTQLSGRYENREKSKNIFCIMQKADEIVKKIMIKQNRMITAFKAQRDPFVLKETKASKSKRKKLPSLTLEGIIWDLKTPLAVISGKVLEKGGVIKGVKVVRIKRKSVILRWQSRQYVLKLKKGDITK